jgi:hypothetical protein
MTTDTALTIDTILDAFATAETMLPHEALHQALEHWPDFADVVLAMLDDIESGAEITESLGDIMFFAIYLMAQQRETRAYARLSAVGMQGERLDLLLGDTVTEHLSHIFVRLYSGDPAPLENLMACADADEFVRGAAFDAFAWLAATGRIDRDRATSILQALFETMLPRSVSFAWVAWQDAVSLLGLESFTPLVRQVFELGWVDDSIMGFEHFEEDLRCAMDPQSLAAKLDAFSDILEHFDDVAGFLATWPYFAKPERPAYVVVQPIRNPLRNVGRNDPCPCGSGKKYKKCCLP